jgi:Protein of unknown function (DUF2855)
MISATELQVNRADIREQRTVLRELPEIVAGQILVRVDTFALTANNVTYAAMGDAMSYWNFFPTEIDGWGIVPVWGFADVVASACDGVDVGERLYGYYPMSTHLIMEPKNVSKHGFSDAAVHRQSLHAVYNSYVRTAADASYDLKLEAEQMLLRPLFTTSFLIDDFLDDNEMFGAHTILISSASSKTAYGAAYALHQRPGLRVVGLTSAANVEFVRGLDCYDHVVSYDHIDTLQRDPSAYVDLAGSAPLRTAVHTHYGDSLLYSCSVGATRWDELGGGGHLPGPKPEMFFAPAQVAKRNKDWGPAEFQSRLGNAWAGFIASVTATEKPWMTVQRTNGPQATGEILHALIAGSSSPSIGHIASMQPSTPLLS